jgi:hypothetical protein
MKDCWLALRIHYAMRHSHMALSGDFLHPIPKFIFDAHVRLVASEDD